MSVSEKISCQYMCNSSWLNVHPNQSEGLPVTYCVHQTNIYNYPRFCSIYRIKKDVNNAIFGNTSKMFWCHLTFAHSLDWWCYFVFTRCLRRQITLFMRNWKLSPRVACGHFYIIMIFYGLVWIFSKKISKCIENSRRQGSSCLDSTWHCKKTHGKYCQYNSSYISIWVLWDTN